MKKHMDDTEEKEEGRRAFGKLFHRENEEKPWDNEPIDDIEEEDWPLVEYEDLEIEEDGDSETHGGNNRTEDWVNQQSRLLSRSDNASLYRRSNPQHHSGFAWSRDRRYSRAGVRNSDALCTQSVPMTCMVYQEELAPGEP